ncbi:MAG: two-component sensor histidine kinase, partial [Schaalia georgiae]|nr:two-component sensor histidine kinase [Schaalia georgiae]
MWRFISSTHPAAVIRQTLSLRLALVITATTLGMVLVFGFVVSAQMRSSVFDSRRAQILGDASLRFSSVQS